MFRVNLIFKGLVLLLAALSAARAVAHPKPGAHADVRFTIDSHAVTGEFVMNLRFAEQLVRWDRVARDEIASDEEEAGRRALLEYLGGGPGPDGHRALDRPNRVLIDGVEVAPVITEYCVIRPSAETRPGFVDVAQAMLPQVSVKVEYPCKSRPRSVSLAWGSYPRDYLAQNRDVPPVSDIDAVLIALGEVVTVKFTEREPEYTWHASAIAPEDRFKAVPKIEGGRSSRGGFAIGLGAAAVVSLVLAAISSTRRGMAVRAVVGLVFAACAAVLLTSTKGPSGPLPSTAEAKTIFESLHANIYRAFDYTRESEIYDALARSVDGPLLARVYDDVYRGLIMQEEGGALSRVKAVEMLEVAEPEIRTDADTGRVTVAVTSRWRVEGVVYHWGHSHTRLNEYRAKFEVAALADGWRIVGVEPLEQRRIETPTSGAAP